MAIIDIVKYEQQEGVIVHKYPSCDLRWGSQLVVYPGQVAFFVKGGKVCDKFTDGTYMLKSNNIPLLNKIINLLIHHFNHRIKKINHFIKNFLL